MLEGRRIRIVSYLIFPLEVMSTRTGSNLKDGDTISTTYEPEGTSLTAKLPSVLEGKLMWLIDILVKPRLTKACFETPDHPI